MRTIEKIKGEIVSAKALVAKLEDELRAASVVVFIAVVNSSTRESSVTVVSSELPTSCGAFEFSWHSDTEEVSVCWQDWDSSSQEVELDCAEEWCADDNVTFFVTSTEAAARRWVARKLR